MNTNFWKMAAALVFGLATLSTSCTDPNIDDTGKVEPVFPEQVNETIEPGKSYSLTINPNLSWEVAISGDTQYFRLVAGGEPVPVASGQAGKHTLTIEALVDESDFDQRQCTLTMTMSEKEQVIGVFTRNGKDRIFNLYQVNATPEGFESGDDVGGYAYSETPSSDIDMHFDGNIYQIYMKVEANFDWSLKETPEWAEPVLVDGRYVSSGKANVPAAICLRGVNPKYPLDGGDGKLVFVVNDNSDNPMEVEKDITLSIDPVKDVFMVGTMSEKLRFNAQGHYFNEMNGEFQEFPMRGSAKGIDGLKIFAVAKDPSYGIYSVVGTSMGVELYGSWVNIALSPDDPEDVLKDWSFTVSVDPNDGAARSAELIIVPGTAVIDDPEYDFFTPDGTEINEEYMQYVYSVIAQEGKTSGGDDWLVSADNDKLASRGARFEKLDASDPENEWISFADGILNVGAENYYQLTVTKRQGAYTLSYGKEMVNFKLFEPGGDGLIESGSPWAEFSGMDEAKKEITFSIGLDGEPYDMKFIVLQTGDWEKPENFAVIWVCYNPYESIGSGDAFAFSGSSNGAELNKMNENSGTFMMLSSEYGTDVIYELTSWSGAQLMLSVDFTFDEIVTVDELDSDWLYCFKMGEGSIALMADSAESKEGTLLFKDESGVVKAILVCGLSL